MISIMDYYIEIFIKKKLKLNDIINTNNKTKERSK